MTLQPWYGSHNPVIKSTILFYLLIETILYSQEFLPVTWNFFLDLPHIQKRGLWFPYTNTPTEFGVLTESQRQILSLLLSVPQSCIWLDSQKYFCITIIKSKNLFHSLKTSDILSTCSHSYCRISTYTKLSMPLSSQKSCTLYVGYVFRGFSPLDSCLMAEAVCWVSISSMASLIKSRKICCSDSARPGPWEDGWLKVSTCRRGTIHSYISKTLNVKKDFAKTACFTALKLWEKTP